jgi:hypothetical protein
MEFYTQLPFITVTNYIHFFFQISVFYHKIVLILQQTFSEKEIVNSKINKKLNERLN